MHDTCAITSARHLEAWADASTGQKDLPRWNRLRTLRGLILTWRRRDRFRWELRQKSRDNPHLMDDIGLTRWQVEAEIAKHFWQQ
ncbi:MULTISPECIES: DUF1127 domain-containing protein [unclassified Rhizobium]|uniref:DUF1127 domain-containing protein n=1 Tax=unclassified Rhizobium TaxID=2613769 RepID=UPI001FCD79AA|nr:MULTISPECIES: DUF1127 domain-containing protein [unclassified Rhizobium]